MSPNKEANTPAVGDQEAGRQRAVSFSKKERVCKAISSRRVGSIVGSAIVFVLIVMVAVLCAMLVIEKRAVGDLSQEVGALAHSQQNSGPPSQAGARDVIDVFVGDEASGSVDTKSYTSTTTATVSSGTGTTTLDLPIRPFLVSGGQGVPSHPTTASASLTSSAAFPTLTDVSAGISPPSCAVPTGKAMKTKTITLQPGFAPSTSWISFLTTSDSIVWTTSISVVLGKPTETETGETTTEIVATVTETSHTVTVVPAASSTEVTSTSSADAASASGSASSSTKAAETTVPAMASASGSAVTETEVSGVVTVTSATTTVVPAAHPGSSSDEIVLPTVTVAENTEGTAQSTITVKTTNVQTVTESSVTTELSSSDTRPNLPGNPQTPPADWSSTRYSTTSYFTTITRVTTLSGATDPVTSTESGMAFETATIIEKGSDASAANTWATPITIPSSLLTGTGSSEPTEFPIPLFPNSTETGAMSSETANSTVTITQTSTSTSHSSSASATGTEAPVVGGASKRGGKPGSSSGGYCIVMIAVAVAMVLI